MHTITIILLQVVLLQLPGLVSPHSEKYLYNIKYDSQDCGTKAVAITGFASGDVEINVAALDDVSGLCSVEAMCQVDHFSDVCMNVLASNKTTETRNDINSADVIFQCDQSNENVGQAVCRYVLGCEGSSLFPHCHFRLATTSDIFENLDLVRNEQAFDDPGLELHSYMVLYSDEGCTEFEGVQGIVAGGETVFQKTDENMTCRDAIACAFFADGELCAANGGTTGGSHSIYLEPSVSTATVCSDASGESCEQIDGMECRRSEIFPSCWYRLPTATMLLVEPENYFVGTAYVQEEATIAVDDDPVATESPINSRAFPHQFTGVVVGLVGSVLMMAMA
eukprot:Nitzschia sp. Nitz4//scaffold23_size168460//79726//80835//NITZ4_002219-RA/size168460-snap-gene-0.158-mRNA-1//-1//CDS//3329543635//5384//frame0